MTEQNKEEAEESSAIRSMRSNPWMISTVVLAVLLVVVAFTGFGGLTGNAVSEKSVSSSVVKFLTSQGITGAEVTGVTKSGGLFEVSVQAGSQKGTIYVTLDGKQLVSDPSALTPLDGSSGAKASGSSKTVTKIDPSQIPIEADTPVAGNANAKVTIVEFADFSCPFCVAASGDDQGMIDYMKSRTPSWEPIVSNVMKDYVQTGKVRFVSFYSMGHSGGHPAQSVAWCLNDQSSTLYWNFYAKAYASYDMQKQTQDVEDLTKMTAIAKTLGADMTKLQSCLDSKKYDSRFDKEQTLGSSLGVQGTPAFIVNGELVSGAQPYSVVKSIIDSELAK